MSERNLLNTKVNIVSHHINRGMGYIIGECRNGLNIRRKQQSALNMNKIKSVQMANIFDNYIIKCLNYRLLMQRPVMTALSLLTLEENQ